MRRRLRRGHKAIDAGAEAFGVEGRADFGVVIEVDVDVARLDGSGAGSGGAAFGSFSCGPLTDAFGPDVEGDVFVSAGVELLGAVQSDVDEVG